MIRRFLQAIFKNPLNALLPFALVAIILDLGQASSLATLIVSAVAMNPLAGLIGESTEAIATSLGPRLSGLMNATFGNAAELIITVIVIREGLLELVKASITGSILGNLLFVLGLSMPAGGL